MLTYIHIYTVDIEYRVIITVTSFLLPPLTSALFSSTVYNNIKFIFVNAADRKSPRQVGTLDTFPSQTAIRPPRLDGGDSLIRGLFEITSHFIQFCPQAVTLKETI